MTHHMTTRQVFDVLLGSPMTMLAHGDLALTEIMKRFADDYAPDDDEPLTVDWLKDVGFVNDGNYGMSLHGCKEYGEDTARFRLVCADYADIEGCCWAFYMRSIEMEEEGGMIPSEPSTRGDLRRLCKALGITIRPAPLERSEGTDASA